MTTGVSGEDVVSPVEEELARERESVSRMILCLELFFLVKTNWMILNPEQKMQQMLIVEVSCEFKIKF